MRSAQAMCIPCTHSSYPCFVPPDIANGTKNLDAMLVTATTAQPSGPVPPNPYMGTSSQIHTAGPSSPVLAFSPTRAPNISLSGITSLPAALHPRSSFPPPTLVSTSAKASAELDHLSPMLSAAGQTETVAATLVGAGAGRASMNASLRSTAWGPNPGEGTGNVGVPSSEPRLEGLTPGGYCGTGLSEAAVAALLALPPNTAAVIRPEDVDGFGLKYQEDETYDMHG